MNCTYATIFDGRLEFFFIEGDCAQWIIALRHILTAMQSKTDKKVFVFPSCLSQCYGKLLITLYRSRKTTPRIVIRIDPPPSLSERRFKFHGLTEEIRRTREVKVTDVIDLVPMDTCNFRHCSTRTI